MATSVSSKGKDDAVAPEDEQAQEEALTVKPTKVVTTDEETGNAREGQEEIPTPGGWKRSTKVLLVTVGILLVAAIVVVSVLLTYDGSEGSQNRDKSVVAPTSAPPGAPSQPIFGPTTPAAQPVAGPTSTANPPTSPIASPPSPAPTPSLRTEVVSFLSTNGVFVDESNAASSQAVTALVDEAVFFDTSDPGKVVQRFAMFALDFGMQGAPQTGTSTTAPSDESDSPTNGTTRLLEQDMGNRELQTPVPLGLPGVDECSWSGVTCTNGTVVDIRSGSRGFTGSIPSEIGLLTALTYLDLSQNQIGGVIPEELYGLTDLQALYLYKNQLAGTISSSAGNWWDMTHLHLSHNQLTGSIPATLGPSDSDFRSFHYVNLKSNNLSGTIPSGLRWRQLFLLDLGFNGLTGTLPVDLGETFGSLRHLFLDHNQFVGTIPESYILAGNGRLEAFAINDNLLTGQVPDNHQLFNKLVMFTMQNNNFNVELRETCRLTVFSGGENVELKADCDICSCTGDFACENC